MDRGIDGRTGAAGEEEGAVQKTESGKFKLTRYPPAGYLDFNTEPGYNSLIKP